MNKESNHDYEILVVDDEADIRAVIKGILGDEGFTVREAGTDEATLKEIATRRPHLVILDIWLQGSKKDGLQLLDIMHKDYPTMPVIMISGHGNVKTAVSAIKRGAYGFIEKPFKMDELVLQVRHALDTARLKRENLDLKSRIGDDQSELIGKSQSILQIRQIVERVAQTNSRILIQGPSGTGKENLARTIHHRSRRGNGAFTILNCGTMRHDQWEAELFGAENSGTRKIGVFEQAHGGTLYIDEIADIPPDVQGKIVRVLQEQSFTRLGSSAKIEVDVRVIASSSRNVQIEMQAGTIRQDLYYRLNVVPIEMPALSERREDIPLLATHFLSKVAESLGVGVRILGDDALASLQSYAWPGNVRQLKNAMEWILIMATGDGAEAIRSDMLPPDITSATPKVLQWERGGEIMAMPLRDAREIFEREYLLAQVMRFGGNISRTATFIGMERSALHRKLKILGVHGNSNEHQPDMNESEQIN